jgi:hypothetical protein
MIFVPRKKHAYGLPPPFTGIALLSVFLYDVRTQNTEVVAIFYEHSVLRLGQAVTSTTGNAMTFCGGTQTGENKTWD